MTVTVQRTPFLRIQRHFPTDIQPLSVELNKSYVDIANAVNDRTIGIFANNFATTTRENWFLQGEGGKQQTSRQVYQITGTGSYPLGFDVSTISAVTRLWGTFVDGSGVWYTLPYVDVASATNQISLTISATNIVITAGAGAPPTISRGLVMVEWLNNV